MQRIAKPYFDILYVYDRNLLSIPENIFSNTSLSSNISSDNRIIFVIIPRR